MTSIGIVEIVNIAIVIFALLSIIFAFGIVWRVEKKLDMSFKFMLAAVVFYTLSKLAPVINMHETVTEYIVLAFNFLFILSFFLSLLEMRSMIRNLDGEK